MIVLFGVLMVGVLAWVLWFLVCVPVPEPAPVFDPVEPFSAWNFDAEVAS